MHIIDLFLRLPLPVSETAEKLGGEELHVTVREGEVYIHNSKIVKSDAITKMGVIHMLDRYDSLLLLEPFGEGVFSHGTSANP
jgi:uncharacterized surface protein with fasciclin (FAS1) repeats